VESKLGGGDGLILCGSRRRKVDEGDLICLQQSNGSFKLNGAFAKLLDSSLKDIIEGE